MRLALFLLLAAVATGYSFWIYTRVELAVRPRRSLAGVRSLVLVLLLALLFDPRVPGDAMARDAQQWVLLDASQSMQAAWDSAVATASALSDEGWRVVTFGDAVRGADALDGVEPDQPRTLLASALERAAEAGVRRVVVISDLRLQDPVAVQAALDALPLEVTVREMPSVAPNAGVAGFVVPDAPRPTESRLAAVDVFATGVDSLDLEVREEGRLVATRRLAAPGPGLRLPVEVELPPTSLEGRLRYTASVTVTRDGFPHDDEAVAYATVGHEEGALVFVSLRPDWEPRYLLPVLAQVTGLSPVGYLRVGPDRFLPMGRAVDRTGPVDSATVRAAARDAALLVVHGLEGRASSWERGLAARTSGRALVFPTDAGGADLLGLRVMAPRPGEWYAAQELPASALAGDLAGVPLQGLPPLAGVMPLAADATGEVPLRAQLAGTGTAQGVLVLRRPGGRREAVALASGFWRWAARDGSGRQAYRSLWAGVAGWLLRTDGTGTGPEPRPARRVFEAGEEVVFLLPMDSTGAHRLQLSAGDEVVLDTLLQGGGERPLPGLQAGRYAYAFLDDAGGVVVRGAFDVSPRNDEMLPARFAAVAGVGGTVGGGGVEEGRGRPLRTMFLPYALILLLLCIEWVARRRVGLR